MRKIFTIIIIVLAINVDAQVTGTFTDSRDGKVYKTVQIGTQIWMAENMQYKTPKSMCNECEIYGRLYISEEMAKVCPYGWHIPSREEWWKLINYCGGELNAGKEWKEIGIKHWKAPNKNATNKFGFNALPAGYYNAIDKAIINKGIDESWWSSTKTFLYGKPYFDYYFKIGARESEDLPDGFVTEYTLDCANGAAFSIRCIKNK